MNIQAQCVSDINVRNNNYPDMYLFIKNKITYNRMTQKAINIRY